MTGISEDSGGYRQVEGSPAIGLDHLTVTPRETDVLMGSTSESYSSPLEDNYDELL